MAVLAALFSTPVVYLSWITPTIIQLLLLIGTGFIGVLYQLASNNSLKYISAKVAACLSYLGIKYGWAGLFGWIIWKDTPNTLTITGMLITVAGAILVIIYDEKSNEANNRKA